MMSKPLIFAHRGASAHAPENTMAAFRLAVEHGCDGIETDAHMTCDGRVALMHDERLLRTTGEDGLLAERTMEELRAMNAGGWFDDAFVEPVPELWELLDLTRSSGIWLNIELKNSVILYDGLEEAVLSEVRRFDLLDRVVFSSFNHDSMARLKALEPKAHTAPLYSEIIHRPADYAALCAADGLHPHHSHVDAAMMASAKAAGIAVRPWTVDDPERARELAALGVDAIITNDPKGVRKALEP